MSILPANGNELAWFGFSARSRGQATAITIAHRHETFSRNPAADAIGRSGSNEHGPDLRRKGSRTVRKIGTGVRRAAQKPYGGEFETGSCVSSWRRSRQF